MPLQLFDLLWKGSVPVYRVRRDGCQLRQVFIDTVRNPVWSVYWHVDRHDAVVQAFKQAGFTTGDTVGIDIDDKPTVYRL